MRDVSTLCHTVTSQCPKAYLETSHALASMINPARPVLAAPMLGGELSGLHPFGTESDRVPGPTPLSNSGTVTQDSAQPRPRGASSAPPLPQTSAFSHLVASDLTTPHNGRSSR